MFVGNEGAVKPICVDHLLLHSKLPNLANFWKTLDTMKVEMCTTICANAQFRKQTKVVELESSCQ